MASFPLTIAGGTPPYSVQIAENTSGAQIPCTGGCDSSNATSRTVTFSALSGTHNYRVRITDSSSPVCVQDQLTSNVTCQTTPGPVDFSASVTQPQCVANALTAATVTLSSITGGNRYAYYQTVSISENNCAGAIAISGSTASFTITAPPPSQTLVYTVRVWGGSDCSVFTDHQVFISSPSCGVPTCTLAITVGTPSC